MPDRHIFAAGGGGFAALNRAMTTAMVEASGKPNPTVLFIPTASGDNPTYIENFSQGCHIIGCIPTCLPLFDSQSWTASPEELITTADIIWVGGGSTKNMLILWRAWEIVDPLRHAYENGTILGGVSAGAICWFEQGNTDSLGPGLGVLDCLGWIKGSCTPHFDEEELRKPILAQQIKDGKIKPGIAIDGNCTAHFVNEQFFNAIPDKQGAGVYFV